MKSVEFPVHSRRLVSRLGEVLFSYVWISSLAGQCRRGAARLGKPLMEIRDLYSIGHHRN